MHEGGGVIMTAITVAAATTTVRNSQKMEAQLQSKSLLHRMIFVKRRGSSTAKMTVTNFEAVKEQFLIDINAVVHDG